MKAFRFTYDTSHDTGKNCDGNEVQMKEERKVKDEISAITTVPGFESAHHPSEEQEAPQRP